MYSMRKFLLKVTFRFLKFWLEMQFLEKEIFFFSYLRVSFFYQPKHWIV